jgi:hypothetical protein
MTQDKALKLAFDWYGSGNQDPDEFEELIKAIVAQLEQEPVAWGVFEGNLHDMFFSQSEAQEMARLKGSHAEVRPLYTYPTQRTEQNFCPRCGKRTNDIHTCTPPMEQNI